MKMCPTDVLLAFKMTFQIYKYLLIHIYGVDEIKSHLNELRKVNNLIREGPGV